MITPNRPRQFFQEEIVYERPPTRLDQIKRTAAFVGDVALQLGDNLSKRADDPYGRRGKVRAQLLEHELRDGSLVFAKRWRRELDFHAHPNGFHLAFDSSAYTYEGTLRIKDSLYAQPGLGFDSHYTVLDSAIRQKASGHETNLRVRCIEYVTDAEKTGEEFRGVFDRVTATVAPLRPDGSFDGAGWGFYAVSEANRMNELGLGILARVREAARVGDLAIEPLEFPPDSDTWHYY